MTITVSVHKKDQAKYIIQFPTGTRRGMEADRSRILVF